MNSSTNTLPDDPVFLKQMIATLHEQHEQQMSILLEQIRLLRQELFGKKSEKLPADSTVVQLPLFDLPEPEHIEPAKVQIPDDPGH